MGPNKWERKKGWPTHKQKQEKKKDDKSEDGKPDDKPLLCTVPKSCFKCTKPPIDLNNLDNYVKVICHSGICTESGWMHLDCFSRFEEQAVLVLSKTGRGRGWSDHVRRTNVWSKNGYDLVLKSCGCNCGKGSLRKDIDYAHDKAAAKAERKEEKKPKKKEKRPELNYPPPKTIKVDTDRTVVKNSSRYRSTQAQLAKYLESQQQFEYLENQEFEVEAELAKRQSSESSGLETPIPGLVRKEASATEKKPKKSAKVVTKYIPPPVTQTHVEKSLSASYINAASVEEDEDSDEEGWDIVTSKRTRKLTDCSDSTPSLMSAQKPSSSTTILGKNTLKGKINLQKPASSFVNSCVPPLLPVPLMALNTRRPTRSSDPAPPRFSKGDAVATPYSAGDVVATRYSAGDVMKPCYSAGDVVRPRLSKGAYEDPKAQQKFKFGNPSISNKAIYTEVSGDTDPKLKTELKVSKSSSTSRDPPLVFDTSKELETSFLDESILKDCQGLAVSSLSRIVPLQTGNSCSRPISLDLNQVVPDFVSRDTTPSSDFILDLFFSDADNEEEAEEIAPKYCTTNTGFKYCSSTTSATKNYLVTESYIHSTGSSEYNTAQSGFSSPTDILESRPTSDSLLKQMINQTVPPGFNQKPAFASSLSLSCAPVTQGNLPLFAPATQGHLPVFRHVDQPVAQTLFAPTNSRNLPFFLPIDRPVVLESSATGFGSVSQDCLRNPRSADSINQPSAVPPPPLDVGPRLPSLAISHSSSTNDRAQSALSKFRFPQPQKIQEIRSTLSEMSDITRPSTMAAKSNSQPSTLNFIAPSSFTKTVASPSLANITAAASLASAIATPYLANIKAAASSVSAITGAIATKSSANTNNIALPSSANNKAVAPPSSANNKAVAPPSSANNKAVALPSSANNKVVAPPFLATVSAPPTVNPSADFGLGARPKVNSVAFTLQEKGRKRKQTKQWKGTPYDSDADIKSVDSDADTTPDSSDEDGNEDSDDDGNLDTDDDGYDNIIEQTQQFQRDFQSELSVQSKSGNAENPKPPAETTVEVNNGEEIRSDHSRFRSPCRIRADSPFPRNRGNSDEHYVCPKRSQTSDSDNWRDKSAHPPSFTASPSKSHHLVGSPNGLLCSPNEVVFFDSDLAEEKLQGRRDIRNMIHCQYCRLKYSSTVDFTAHCQTAEHKLIRREFETKATEEARLQQKVAAIDEKVAANEKKVAEMADEIKSQRKALEQKKAENMLNIKKLKTELKAVEQKEAEDLSNVEKLKTEQKEAEITLNIMKINAIEQIKAIDRKEVESKLKTLVQNKAGIEKLRTGMKAPEQKTEVTEEGVKEDLKTPATNVDNEISSNVQNQKSAEAEVEKLSERKSSDVSEGSTPSTDSCISPRWELDTESSDSDTELPSEDESHGEGVSDFELEWLQREFKDYVASSDYTWSLPITNSLADVRRSKTGRTKGARRKWRTENEPLDVGSVPAVDSFSNTNKLMDAFLHNYSSSGDEDYVVGDKIFIPKHSPVDPTGTFEEKRRAETTGSTQVVAAKEAALVDLCSSSGLEAEGDGSPVHEPPPVNVGTEDEKQRLDQDMLSTSLSDTDFNCMMVSVSGGHSLNSSMSVNASLKCPQSPRAQGKMSDDQMTSLEQELDESIGTKDVQVGGFMFSDAQLQELSKIDVLTLFSGTEPLSYHLSTQEAPIKLVSFAKHMDTVKQLEYCQELNARLLAKEHSEEVKLTAKDPDGKSVPRSNEHTLAKIQKQMANKKVGLSKRQGGSVKDYKQIKRGLGEVKEMLAEAKEFLDADSMARGSEKVEKTETKIDLSRQLTKAKDTLGDLKKRGLKSTCHEVKQLMARIEEAEMLVATSTNMSHAAPEKSNNIENDQFWNLDLLKEEFSQVFKGNDELMTDWKNTTAENINLKAEHVETKHQLFLALDENFRLVEEKDQTSADFAKQIHELSEQLQASREETRALVLQDADKAEEIERLELQLGASQRENRKLVDKNSRLARKKASLREKLRAKEDDHSIGETEDPDNELYQRMPELMEEESLSEQNQGVQHTHCMDSRELVRDLTSATKKELEDQMDSFKQDMRAEMNHMRREMGAQNDSTRRRLDATTQLYEEKVANLSDDVLRLVEELEKLQQNQKHQTTKYTDLRNNVVCFLDNWDTVYSSIAKKVQECVDKETLKSGAEIRKELRKLVSEGVSPIHKDLSGMRDWLGYIRTKLLKLEAEATDDRNARPRFPQLVSPLSYSAQQLPSTWSPAPSTWSPAPLALVKEHLGSRGQVGSLGDVGSRGDVGSQGDVGSRGDTASQPEIPGDEPVPDTTDSPTEDGKELMADGGQPQSLGQPRYLAYAHPPGHPPPPGSHFNVMATSFTPRRDVELVPVSPGRRAPLGAAGGTHAPVGMLVYSNVQPTARLNIQGGDLGLYQIQNPFV